MGERPSDGAACWLFDSSVREWFSGGSALPVSLAGDGGLAPGSAARDPLGNMIVYWSGEESGRPAGGAGCWLFASGSWVSGG